MRSLHDISIRQKLPLLITLLSGACGLVVCLTAALYLQSEHRLAGLVWQCAIVAAVALVACELLAYRLASLLRDFIFDPILALVDAAQRVTRERDFSFRASISGHEETRLLVEAFNHMLYEVEHRDEELLRQSEQLEEEVQARIAELRTVNTQLATALDAAEAASRAKGEFLANMSHEIRTPINGMLGMTELALKTNLTAEQRQYLEMAQLSGGALLNLINDILDFSKIESGKLELEKLEFELRECLAETMKMLGLSAHNKDLELVCEVAPQVPRRVVGDPARLRQVLINLVGNAIKFTEHGEVVMLVERLLQQNRDIQLHFVVRDTGIGISDNEKSMLFSAFTQADSSTSRKYGGTGLGLAICSRLVDLMRGSIWVDSQPGHGSTFHFTAAFRVAESGERAADPCQSLAGVRALVVDDNSTARRVISSMLTAWGMRVTSVATAEIALDKVLAATSAGAAFQFIVADTGMAEMSGWRLAELILGNGAAAPQMVLLASGGETVPQMATALADIPILLKPVAEHELMREALAAVGAISREARAPANQPVKYPVEAPLNILLAEDNSINEFLICKLLECLGHRTTVAHNGLEAVDLARRQSFDLIFMDLQMPEMDGFQATALIRQSVKDGRHIPIVAVTAHALHADRERCLASGMDGYVSKPVSLESLQAAIAQVCAQTAPPSGALWNRPETLGRLAGDEKLLDSMLAIFRTEAPKLLADMKQAFAIHDLDRVAKISHTLKGELGYFSAEEARRTTIEIEELARGGNQDDAAAKAQLLYEQVNTLLQAFGDDGFPAPKPQSSPASSQGDPHETTDC